MAVVLVVELKNQPALSPTVWLMYLVGGACDVAAVIRMAIVIRCRMVAPVMGVGCCTMNGLLAWGRLLGATGQGMNKGVGVYRVNKA